MSDVILVSGATGFIGQAVVHELLQRGYRVRALTRNTATWPFDEHPMLERAQGDIRDSAALTRAMIGAQAVVHLAAAKNDEPDSADINVGGAQNLIDAARQTRVSRIVNISTQSAKLPRRGAYGETKKQADELLHASGIPVITLRSSLVYSDMHNGILGTIIRYSSLPVIPMIGPGTCRFRPIHRDDLAQIVVRALSTPNMIGNVYDVGGPDLLSLDDIAKRIVDMRGVRRPIVHIPIWLGLMTARVFSVLPRSPLTVSNVLGGAADVPMDIGPLLRDCVQPPMRNFDQGLREIFADELQSKDLEAQVLLSYVLSSVGHLQPSSDVCDRYRQTLAAHGIPDTPLDPTLLRSRFLLGAADCATRIRYPDCLLRKKLLIAAAVAETQPASADMILPRDHSLPRFIMRSIRLTTGALCTMLTAVPLLLHSSTLRRYAGEL